MPASKLVKLNLFNNKVIYLNIVLPPGFLPSEEKPPARQEKTSYSFLIYLYLYRQLSKKDKKGLVINKGWWAKPSLLAGGCLRSRQPGGVASQPKFKKAGCASKSQTRNYIRNLQRSPLLCG